jgi:hypothetical protein
MPIRQRRCRGWELLFPRGFWSVLFLGGILGIMMAAMFLRPDIRSRTGQQVWQSSRRLTGKAGRFIGRQGAEMGRVWQRVRKRPLLH